jgi:flagellar biosynthetic protein FliR
LNALASQGVLAAFVVFSRIGACLMLMPGFASPRIPVQVRLFVAIALSLAITPLVFDDLRPRLDQSAPIALLGLMASELLIGAMIGLLARVFFVALETIGSAMAMAMGLTSNMGAPVNEDEPLPAIATLLTLAATALLFLTDQHLEIFRALRASYTSLPVGGGLSAQFALVQIVNTTSRAFLLALQIGSPFLILSVVVNLAVGLTSRLVPTVQIFFLATPFLLIGGLFLLDLTIKPFLQLFMDAFSHFLVTG